MRRLEGVIKTKLLKIAELGKRVKDIVIGTEGGEKQKAEKRRMRTQASQTHDSRNRSNIYDLSTRIE